MSLNNKYEYVAIDFETANSNLTSACAIGIVCAKNGKVVCDKYFLINPEEPFSEFNITIHHITPEMVQNEKTFKDLWSEIKDVIDGEIVVCHNAMFDIAVLKACLEKYNLEFPNISIGCTLKVSRIAYKGVLHNCKLNTISNYLQVEHNHHNASSDAMVCFYLVERVKRMFQAIDIVELFEIMNLGFGVLNKNIYRGCFNKYKEKVIENNTLGGAVFSSTGKPKTMTKTEFRKKIEENGGYYSKDINKGISSFVIFTNPEKRKLHELEVLKESRTINIYNEDEFINIIKGKKDDK